MTSLQGEGFVYFCGSQGCRKTFKDKFAYMQHLWSKSDTPGHPSKAIAKRWSADKPFVAVSGDCHCSLPCTQSFCLVWSAGMTNHQRSMKIVCRSPLNGSEFFKTWLRCQVSSPRKGVRNCIGLPEEFLLRVVVS